MKHKFIVILMILTLAATLAACGGGEETTLTGMVVSVDGTVISLMEMDAENMGGRDFSEGERPEMPEGMEGFDFGNFNPGDFEGAFPEGEMPEMPEGMTPPEGMTMPEDGQMPDFGGERPDFGKFAEDVETKNVDVADAHISVEIENGKESGSLNDLVPGAFVTVTLNSKGQATYVLISSRTGFGGGRDMRQTG